MKTDKKLSSALDEHLVTNTVYVVDKSGHEVQAVQRGGGVQTRAEQQAHTEHLLEGDVPVRQYDCIGWSALLSDSVMQYSDRMTDSHTLK